jgi:hypothetical protein
MSYRCFHGFSFHLPIFSKNRSVSSKNRPEIATLIFKKNGRFISQTNQFIGETGRILVFPVFSIHPSSPVHFSQISPIFTEFCRIFQKPTGSVRSGFPSSANFLNTGGDP